MKNKRNYLRHFHVLTLALTCLITADGLLGRASPVFAQTPGPSWSYTGSLNTAGGGQATLLPGGKVLVAGGDILGKAELYDPATGTWSYTGSLPTNWSDFTATLLQNGKVLVAGGGTSSSPSWTPTNAAALYDPVSGTWSPTGKLITAHASHTAALLQNGKVLIVGGFGESFDTLDTAELYDPETGTWTLTGKLNVARYILNATLLKSGKVLITGGTNDDDFASTLASAELYDPATGTWSITGSLNLPRALHTATLLPSGKVLVTGGYNWPPVSLRSAELYDPTIGTWSVTGDLIAARDSHTATLLPNGKVLVAGGADWNRGLPPAPCLPNCAPLALNSAELYDPATETWTATASLNVPRSAHTATLLGNGKVLAVGGGPGGRSAELYGSGASSAPNAIDDAQFFVRQQYLDFLNREPDSSGLAFWTNEIASCGMDQQCVDVKRINVAAAYFLSIEFQQTGYLVYRTYKAAYGDLPGAPVAIKLNEFLPDTRKIGQGVIVNQSGWEQALENNKQAFATEFVERSRFTSAYQASMSPSEFVDALFANAGVTPSESDRAAAISEFAFATTTTDVAARARALRRVAENSTLAQQEFNRAFVLMQYFGYLRRNPNDAPDTNFEGYNFWLNKLNQFDGNFVNAEMVKAFITSAEYRRRFGP